MSLYPPPVHTKAQWKTWITIVITIGSLAWGMGLCKCGRSVTIVSVLCYTTPMTNGFILVTLNALPASPPSRPFLAKNVLFSDRGETIMVFYLESHEMFVCVGLHCVPILTCRSVAYELDSWNRKWLQKLPTRM
jgi:hypothetical protein